MQDVMDMINDSGSEFEGCDDELDSDEEFVLDSSAASESESDNQVTGDGVTVAGAMVDSDWDSEDDVPLQRIVDAELTASAKYQWRNRPFTPPDNTEFLGDTTLLDLPTAPDGQLTPYTLFKMFVTDDMLQRLADETNRYSVEKDGRSVDTTPQEIQQLIGVFFHMGLVQMPSIRSYWEVEHWFEPVAGVFSRDRFLKLMTVLHIVDNNTATDEQKLDKLWKLRPWLAAMRLHFLEIPPTEFQSIDEIIVPFKGRSGLRVYMPNKPHKWGFKLWGRSDATGFMYDFDVYQPTRANEQVSELGRSAGVVEKMTDSLPEGKFFKAFADNYFSSVALAEKLKRRQILYIGTVRMNRVTGNNLPSDKDLKKAGRGTFAAQVEQNTNLVCVRWNDNKIVSLISSYVGVEPVTKARRWDKKKKEYVEIDRPKVVEEYNKFMGGIDLLNMCTNMYKYHFRSRRWYIYILFHSLTIAMVNAWFLFRRRHEELGTDKKSVHPLKKFQSQCALSLTSCGKGKKRPRGRPSLDQVGAPPTKSNKQRYQALPPDVQKDRVGHFPIYDKFRQRCKLCPRRKAAFSYIKCEKCNVHLCLNKDRNCFLLFH
jgi:hypothetical protein